MDRITARIFDADGNPGAVINGRRAQIELNVPEGGRYEEVALEELNKSLDDPPALPSEG